MYTCFKPENKSDETQIQISLSLSHMNSTITNAFYTLKLFFWLEIPDRQILKSLWEKHLQ